MLHLSRQQRALSSALSAFRSSANELPQQHVQNPETPSQKVKPIIGLEVHAQLNTRSKLFSSGGNAIQASPNSQLDLLDVSIPGSLPKLNGSALRAAILTGLGLNCTIQDVIHFDRKNYFYSDMPAGFQITQYNRPIALNGYIDFVVRPYHRSQIARSQQYDIMRHLYEHRKDGGFSPYMKRSHIKQLQLEQDSAKTLHETAGASSCSGVERVLNDLVDYNRSGSGLVEIVFEPDLTNADEASSLVGELIMLLRALKTCDCQLQEGSLRVDANISIESIGGQPVPKDVANRVELKNLNSLRSLNRGIAYEIQRQAIEITAGNRVAQESRTFDTKRGQTVLLRAKETALDYRYVPEPSLPPLVIDPSLVEEISQALNNDLLPNRMRDMLLSKFQLDLVSTMELVSEPGLADYFLSVMESQNTFDANSVADFLIYSVANLKHVAQALLPLKVNLEDANGDFMTKLRPAKMQRLLKMVFDDEISFATGYETMKCLFTSGDAAQEPRELVENFGWYQIRDERTVDQLCLNLIKGMKSTSKKYSKRGCRQALRMMLTKLNELHNDRVCVKQAIISLNKQLKPPPLPFKAGRDGDVVEEEVDQ